MDQRQEHFNRPTTTRPPSLINLTFLTVIIAVAASFGGYLLARTWLPANDISNYLNLNNLPQNISIDLEQPLTDIAQKQQGSIAGVYRATVINNSVGQALFNESDLLGSAVVVTSDGWLMTTDQVGLNTGLRVVLADKVYEVTDTKRDEFAKLVFIKIEADSLQPIDFQLTESIKTGERLFTNIDSPHSLEHTFYTDFLTNSHYVKEKYLFSDSLDYYLQIFDNQDANLLAAPYFNLDGNLLGLAYNLEDQTLLLPVEYLKQAIKNLLNETTRPSLGLYYVDMENNSGFERKGVLVYHPSLRAVVYNSPAALAGISVGDQIVAINNDTISNSRSLTSIIQNYRVGDTVTAKIFRDGQEQDIEIEL